MKKIILLLLSLLFSFYYVIHYHNDIYVEFEANIHKNNSQYIGEIYYSDSTFAEKIKSKKFYYKKIKNKFQKVQIQVDDVLKIQSIRLDPLLKKGLIEIRNFKILHGNKEYSINFKTIEKNYKHNIEIIKKGKNLIIIKTTGIDPYIYLSENIKMSSFPAFETILKSIICWIGIIVLFYFSQNIFFRELVLVSIVAIYSFYTLLFSTPHLASYLLVMLSVMSIYVAWGNGIKNYKNYIVWVIIFLGLYFTLSYISVLYFSEYANKKYLLDIFPYIIMASIIPLGFFNTEKYNKNFIRWSFVVILMIMLLGMYLMNHGYININSSEFTLLDEKMKRTNWTQKNYMFWYVLLMWGTISLFNIKRIKEAIFIFFLLGLSYYILKDGYSQSAGLAFMVGSVVYFLLSFLHFNKKVLMIIIGIFTAYIILSPIIFSIIDLSSYHHRLIIRMKLYHTSVEYIKHSLFYGYGFGSTLSLHLHDIMDTSKLPAKYFIDSFPGGHPHNLSLLFWIEFGLIGAIFLAYFVHKLLATFVENTYQKSNLAGLFAMIISMDIITSFSWSIWYPQVLLTYGFFIALLVLSMKNNSQGT
jgi:hypothetical protein